MGQINIYRIESGKRNSFLEKIKEYFGDPVVKDIEENSTTYNLAFYTTFFFGSSYPPAKNRHGK